MALSHAEAAELTALAHARGLRLGCSPSTFLGEAQQTAASIVHGGGLGTVRAIYADVNWGRIETWHPAPAPFYDVGVMVDVGLYPLTLVTSMLGPARSVRAWGWQLIARAHDPRRASLPHREPGPGGGRHRTRQRRRPAADDELLCGTARRGRWGSLEFHGDDGSLYLESFQAFDSALQVAPFGGTFEDVPLVRPPYPGTAWARGVADMAAAIGEGRPHRASAELASHIVEILDGVAASRADAGTVIQMTSTFEAPPLMDWARS